MRRLLLVTVSTLAILVSQPSLALDVVTCVNCSTLGQQLLDYARQLEQLTNEITTAENEVLNTLALPGTVYRDLTGEIQRITGILKQADMLVGNTKAMIDNLGNATSYPDGSPSAWQNTLAADNQSVARAMQAAGRVLQDQQQTLQDNAATMAELHSQAMGTSGRQATLQTVAGVTSSMGQQIHSLQGTQATFNQAMLTYYTKQANREEYIRRLVTLQQEAGSRAACKNISSLGFPLPPTCK